MARRRPLRVLATPGAVRFVGYIRVSTEEQSREGVSLGAQEERIRAYCVAQGFTLATIYRDAGVSGKVAPERRPGLAVALEAVRSGAADGLVVLKLDRLSRSTRDVLDLVDESRAGWRLASVSEQLDTGSAAGRLVVTVLAALSEMEREQIGERTRDALASIAREGRGRSRFTPFGWRTAAGATENAAGDRAALVPHAAEQAALRRILELHSAGLGPRRIARELAGAGTHPRTGRPWGFESVRAILRRAERWVAAELEPAA